LTVDVTKAQAFEAALQIVELVKRLVVKRDAALSESAATTPVESEKPEWKQLRADKAWGREDGQGQAFEVQASALLL
jgi:hypothetical protein